MEVLVDLAGGRVWLEGWEDFGSLAVSARAERPGEVDDRALARLAAALETAGAGWMDGDGDARIPPGSLRTLAAQAADDEGMELGDGWEANFTGMLDHAGSSGWIDDDGAVRAHVEWRDA
jgi:hypothetical protein